jgi:hypothetical protein
MAAKAIERNRNHPDGRNHVCPPPGKPTYDGKEVHCYALGGCT